MNDITIDKPVVIVGGGLAGGRAAEFLATRGKLGGRVVLLGSETERPYHRPLLSKDALFGRVSDERFYLRPETFYTARGIDLRLGATAARLDATKRSIGLLDGNELSYGAVVLAPGARPRRLTVPGAQLAGVEYLRNAADARRLEAGLSGDWNIVIIGGGFIGLEVASAAIQRGHRVKIVEMQQGPLHALLGDAASRLVRNLHERSGVTFVLGDPVTEVTGSVRVSGVQLASGDELQADLVVVGIGVTPDVDWLRGSGIELGDGIVVDEFCRTNLPLVYAAGDAARWRHAAFGSIRVEHETNAQNQAMAAARNLVGPPSSYTAIPYVWSDQCGVKLEYLGHTLVWDDVIIDQSIDRRWAVAQYVSQGRVVAVMTLDRPDVISSVRALMQTGSPVLPKMLRGVVA